MFNHTCKLWILILVVTSNWSRGDAVLDASGASPVTEARKLLYTDRDRAIRILTDAARKSPDDSVVWAEYVNALDIEEFDAMADRAVRHALRINPDSTDLLFAHARLVGGGAAINIFADLAKVKGYREVAEWISEDVSLGLSIPTPGSEFIWKRPPQHCPLACDRLIVLAKFDRAAAVIQEGLNGIPEQVRPALMARKAVLLALAGKFDEAIAAQRSSKFLQERIEESWFGVADVFLAKGKAQFAIDSFGGIVNPADPGFRRVLGMANARSGNFKAAEKLLTGKDLEDQLLLLQVFLASKDSERAKTLGQSIVGPMEVYQGSYGGPWLRNYDGPESLRCGPARCRCSR